MLSEAKHLVKDPSSRFAGLRMTVMAAATSE